VAHASPWIDLEGAVNVRDVGGLPSRLGGRTRSRRLLRADNLQDLTAEDCRVLVDEFGVRKVADLRTGVEVRSEGPGPLTNDHRVSVEHLSLFPGDTVDVEVTDSESGPVVLPWQSDDPDSDKRKQAAYGYPLLLQDRPDSVLRALRLIADPGGATVVHCAAGKDRTGVVVAVALSAVGVDDTAIVADYLLSADRIELIIERLSSSRTYADDLAGTDADHHRPRASAMEQFLGQVDAEFGGVSAWLKGHGWTEDDQRALEATLLDR
jgi:protein tyrosine/serine phosphatase